MLHDRGEYCLSLDWEFVCMSRKALVTLNHYQAATVAPQKGVIGPSKKVFMIIMEPQRCLLQSTQWLDYI